MSINAIEQMATPRSRRRRTFRFRCRDVTGMHDMDVADVVRGTPSGTVAQTLAARMDLPTNVPWSLRNDRTGAWLQDDVALDDQLDRSADPSLTLTPKTHLGGGRG